LNREKERGNEMKNKPCTVVSLGGSIMFPGDGSVDLIGEVCGLLKKHSGSRQFMIVVGGGRVAREFISYARQLDGDESYLDEIGIHCSRLNAMLMLPRLGDSAAPVVAATLDQGVELAHEYDIVVMGGTHPGHTTDAVAAMMCERLHGELFVIATSVDGIYDKDPVKFPSAVRIPEISLDDLYDMMMSSSARAGPNMVVDPMAVRIMKRSGLSGHVIDGRDIGELERAITGRSPGGTRMVP